MSAVVVEIADAVVDTIEAATLSQSFTAERTYVGVENLATLSGLRVTVAPLALESAAADLKPRVAYEWDIGVTVQKKVDPSILADVDAMILLVEEITAVFRGKRLEGTDARCVGGRNDPVFDRAKLDEMRLFDSVVVLTFRLTR